MPSAAHHPRLLRPARNQPCEIGKARVSHQVRPLMPLCYSMQCGWLGSGHDSGCSPEVRFVNMPNISYFKVVEFNHFEIGSPSGISPSSRKLSVGTKKFILLQAQQPTAGRIRQDDQRLTAAKNYYQLSIL